MLDMFKLLHLFTINFCTLMQVLFTFCNTFSLLASTYFQDNINPKGNCLFETQFDLQTMVFSKFVWKEIFMWKTDQDYTQNLNPLFYPAQIHSQTPNRQVHFWSDLLFSRIFLAEAYVYLFTFHNGTILVPKRNFTMVKADAVQARWNMGTGEMN